MYVLWSVTLHKYRPPPQNGRRCISSKSDALIFCAVENIDRVLSCDNMNEFILCVLYVKV